MSTPLKVILMLVAWFLFSFIAYRSCIQPCCTDGLAAAGDLTDQEGPPLTSLAAAPVYFDYNSAEPQLNPSWDSLRSSLISEAARRAGATLEVIGYYYESEDRPAGQVNLGFARAGAVRDLLAPELPADRMEVRARAYTTEPADSAARYAGMGFSWDEPEAPAADDEAVADAGQDEVEVEELEDRVIIRFPYNSDEPQLVPEVRDYLSQMASRLARTGERVQVIGHTDNLGEDDFNMELGRKRAEAVKRVLVARGVAADRILIESKGESQPEASNDSEAGRRENRRVELRLIQ